MNSGLQKRLYELEVIPPAAVWEKLSVNIDEINADNPIAKKILNAELVPPAGTWEKINSVINVAEKEQPEKKAIAINLRRLAAAAIFMGLVVTAWILFRNNNERSAGLAVEIPGVKKAKTDTNSTKPENDNLTRDSDTSISDPSVGTSIASSTPESFGKEKRKNNFGVRNANSAPQLIKGRLIALNAPLRKSFRQPIDDLSSVTADQHYLTMVNSNGRLIKIPAQLAYLAPHLQDKPISEDIYEVMFGEGTYWKETLNDWRKKIASSPVTSGDAFTSFVEMLKTIQDK